GPSLCAAVRSPPGWSSAAPTSSLPTALAGDSDVFRLGSLLALGDVEFDLLPFLQAAVAAAGDRAEVHEHVRAALDRDEAVALVAVEPLHGALRHLDLLGCACGAPPWLGAALATCLSPGCRGTRGGVNVRPANCPAGGTSPFGQRGRLERTPGPGACPARGPGHAC